MRTWQTKINNTAPAASGELDAGEDNARGAESNNLALSAGLALDPYNGADSDLYQTAQAVARYASGGVYALDTGAANTYVLGGSGAFRMPKTYFDGMRINWVPGHSNTGASTANAFAIGSVPILNWNGAALTGEEIIVAFEASMVYSVAANAFLLVPWMRYAYASNLIVPMAPQGYLTPISAGTGSFVPNADVNGATTLYYTPIVGNLAPIYVGGQFFPTTFAELSLGLTASHSANALYDVFLFNNSGTLTVATGPAWATATAGSCARGTGAGTPQLSRVGGFWVNTVSMTARNGASTYTIGAGLGTYVGSIFIDGAAGQVSCHVASGQSRKWGIWNAYNRRPLALQVSDPTSSWNYSTNTTRQSNAAAGNALTVFCGLPEENVNLDFTQVLTFGGAGSITATIGVGINATNAFSGQVGTAGMSLGAGTILQTLRTQGFLLAGSGLGINKINACESGNGVATSTFNGGGNMLMTAQWRG